MFDRSGSVEVRPPPVLMDFAIGSNSPLLCSQNLVVGVTTGLSVIKKKTNEVRKCEKRYQMGFLDLSQNTNHDDIFKPK